MHKPNKTNAVLLAIIGVLALIIIARPGSSSAWAQTSATEPPFNAAEQRKHMILSLQQINTRLSVIEAKLNAGLSVKVTEMPPVIVKEPASKK
jgi:hypothetical protein